MTGRKLDDFSTPQISHVRLPSVGSQDGIRMRLIETSARWFLLATDDFLPWWNRVIGFA